MFASDVTTFVAPARGGPHYRRLLEALFAVQAKIEHVDFRRLAEVIRIRVPRRALLVVFSDLLDEAHARPLAEHAAVLRQRHLPVCVTMHDPLAESLAARAPW